jgi:hypothetical protein
LDNSVTAIGWLNRTQFDPIELRPLSGLAFNWTGNDRVVLRNCPAYIRVWMAAEAND